MMFVALAIHYSDILRMLLYAPSPELTTAGGYGFGARDNVGMFMVLSVSQSRKMFRFTLSED